MNINIPNPCHEDWTKMTPNEQGRFCGSCQKTVVDFTDFSSEDIQHYFTKHYGQKVCGHFKKEQLAKINIQIPSAIFYQISASRRFALALLIVFGTTLFSCTDNNGNSATIEKIEVVDSLVKNNHDTLENRNSIKPKKIKEIKLFEPRKKTRNGTITPTENKLKPQISNNVIQGTVRGITSAHFEEEVEYTTGIVAQEIDSNIIFSNPDVMPEFIGGESELYNFVNTNLHLPENAKENNINGKVIVQFIVEKDGSISNIEIVRKLSFGCDEEVIRIINSMPKWKPGRMNDEPVRMKMTLPIKIGE
ncbi:MAG: energy transducer TonB [Candidatus Methylacidiphilales bacterium]